MGVGCHIQDTNILNMLYFYPVFLVELFPLIIFSFLSAVDHGDENFGGFSTVIPRSRINR